MSDVGRISEAPTDRPDIPRYAFGIPSAPYPQIVLSFVLSVVAVLSLIGAINGSRLAAQIHPFGLPLRLFEVMYLIVFGGVAAMFARDARRISVLRRAELARLRADSLPERAKHAAQVLQEATTLVEELQAELTARTVLLEDVQRQAAETTQRIADMQKLSHVDDETTRILNKYFDEALKYRLEDLEHGSRRREWVIGTVVALVIGVGAILFSHYILGF